IADVAFAAGFASVRQFNDTMRAHFAMTPSEIRRRPVRQLAGVGAMTLRIAHRTPYAATAMLDWLRRHPLGGVAELDGTTYRRVLPSGAVVEIELGAGAMTLTTSIDDVRALPD